LKKQFSDYQPLTRPQSSSDSSNESGDNWSKFRHPKADPGEEGKDWLKKTLGGKRASFSKGQINRGLKSSVDGETEITELSENEPKIDATNHSLTLKRGHGLTYAALFLFTVILYARPAEFYPSGFTSSIALIVGSITLAIFVPSQLSIGGTLTARPREVNLILLLCLTGLLSIPLAISPAEAWATFNDTFIRCIVIFIVMVNVIRTEARLKGLLFLALIVSIWLSVGAINDYRLGLTSIEGYRIAGRGSGIFGNSNDMALHLVTMVPIAVALFFGGRMLQKIMFGSCALLMIAAIVLTYSRGGSIGLLFSLVFLAWKIGRERRFAVVVWGLILLGAFLALAPGNYGTRLASIFNPSLDAMGSSDMRREILYVSIWTALRHPLLGIGMGNFHIVSVRELVSHNAYTQVAAEMGIVALVCYTMFIVTPFRRLGLIARETFATRSNSRYHYLAVGLQASLLGYMVTSFFASVAYIWYVYYLVAYAVCLRRIYESDTGNVCVLEKRSIRRKKQGANRVASLTGSEG
jgi:putative inorganic carbon (HCO3(-)) transporter